MLVVVGLVSDVVGLARLGGGVLMLGMGLVRELPSEVVEDGLVEEEDDSTLPFLDPAPVNVRGVFIRPLVAREDSGPVISLARGLVRDVGREPVEVEPPSALVLGAQAPGVI